MHFHRPLEHWFCDIHNLTQKMYDENFNFNSNTKFDPNLHSGSDYPFFVNSEWFEKCRNLCNRSVFKIFCMGKSFSNFIQLPDVLNWAIALIKKKKKKALVALSPIPAPSRTLSTSHKVSSFPVPSPQNMVGSVLWTDLKTVVMTKWSP